MSQDRPSAVELLEAVRGFLTGEVMPALGGRLAFHTRVAAGALAIVERELRLGPQADAAELARLQHLLADGRDAAGTDRSLHAWNRDLADRLRRGELDDRRDEVLAHLRATVDDKLRIASPRYAGGREG